MSEQTLFKPTIKSKEPETLAEPVLRISALEMAELRLEGTLEEKAAFLMELKANRLQEPLRTLVLMAVKLKQIVVTEETHADVLSARVRRMP